MIERQIDSMIRNFEARLAQQGLARRLHEVYRSGRRASAASTAIRPRRAFCANLVLEAIENVENFEVSDE